jgi:hypothetical protein
MQAVKLDRNFFKNLSSVNQQIDKSSLALAKDFYVFVAYCFQYHRLEENLFGYKIFTPEQFAGIMGYNKRYLINKHPEPLHCQDLSPEERDELVALDKSGRQPMFNSYLDNAIYHLYYVQLPLSQGGQTPEGGGYTELTELRTFSHLSKHYGKKRAISYEYAEHPTFVNNLARYFIMFDFNLYLKLNAKERDVYFYLVMWRSNKVLDERRNNKEFDYQPVTVAQFTFDYLIDLFELRRAEGFSKEKQSLKALIDSINNAAGYPFVELRFSRSTTSRWENVPLLRFEFSPTEVEIIKSETFNRYRQFIVYNAKARFRNYCRIKGLTYRSTYEFNDHFKKYLRDGELDAEAKDEVIYDTYMQAYGKNVPNFEMRKLQNHMMSYF